MNLPRLYEATNLVPRAFSSFKIAVGETPRQGCWNTVNCRLYARGLYNFVRGVGFHRGQTSEAVFRFNS